MPNANHNSYSQHHLPSESKQSSENNIFSNLTNGLVKLTQYILNNPGKAITLGLAGQVIGSSALGQSQNQSSVGNNNLTQELIDNPYLADSLAVIEQRVAPALNLTWLNQTDANQIESIPAWLYANDTHVDEPLNRTKRSPRRDEVIDYLLSSKICLKNVRQNYEYMYASNSHRDNRERVFTWIPRNKEPEATWLFSHSDGETFSIYNIYHKKYLYATANVFDHGKWYVTTLDDQGSERSKWRVEVLTTQGERGGIEIALWNHWTGGTLYVPGDTQDPRRRRYVFTGKLREGWAEARWQVEDCGFRNLHRREIPDTLEDITSPEEKESSSFSDKAPTRLAFFQIKQPDQITTPISDFDNRAENQTSAVKVAP